MRQQLPGTRRSQPAAARRAVPAAPAPIRPFSWPPGAQPQPPSGGPALVTPHPQVGGHPRTLLLREHPLALVSRLLPLLALAALVAGVAALLGDARVLVVGLAATVGAAVVRVAAWRMFTVSVRYDRIQVRRLRLIVVRQTTYSLPGFLGLTCEQGVFDRLCNAGTLVLSLPNHTLRFSMLTPYSEINRTLGW